MSKTNTVIEGRFKNSSIIKNVNCLKIGTTELSKDYVTSYEIITESNSNKYSFWKGALGVALFGGIGAIAGVNNKRKEYYIAIEWKYKGLYKDSKSLICINEDYYKILIKSMF